MKKNQATALTATASKATATALTATASKATKEFVLIGEPITNTTDFVLVGDAVVTASEFVDKTNSHCKAVVPHSGINSYSEVGEFNGAKKAPKNNIDFRTLSTEFVNLVNDWQAHRVGIEMLSKDISNINRQIESFNSDSEKMQLLINDLQKRIAKLSNVNCIAYDDYIRKIEYANARIADNNENIERLSNQRSIKESSKKNINDDLKKIKRNICNKYFGGCGTDNHLYNSYKGYIATKDLSNGTTIQVKKNEHKFVNSLNAELNLYFESIGVTLKNVRDSKINKVMNFLLANIASGKCTQNLAKGVVYKSENDFVTTVINNTIECIKDLSRCHLVNSESAEKSITISLIERIED